MISHQPPDKRKKRKRGGQKGNQNARKHGFYSAGLNPAETCLFWNIANLGANVPELITLRIKLSSVLQHNSANRRVLRETAKIIAKWYHAKYGLHGEENVVFKKLVRSILENINTGR